MPINSHTALLGLLGKPIRHSLSPAIHNAIFQKESLNAVYLCFEIDSTAVRSAVEGLRCLGARGFNVTIPYKEEVIPLLDEVSEEVSLIGAVNTVKNVQGRLKGFNTDGAGFIDSLKIKARFAPEDKEVCILGAGGAAKSIAFYLCKEKVSSLSIYDKDHRKMSDVCARLRSLFPQAKIQELGSSEEIPGSADLLINATGVGTKESDPVLLPRSFFARYQKLLVYDLIYSAEFTPLLRHAQEYNLEVMNGVWMLIYQALRALSLWFDREDFLKHADSCCDILKENK